MFHRSSARFATGILLAVSAVASATNYDISTREDVVRQDGFCSIREAMTAINTQRGVIGNRFSDELGVDLRFSSGDVTFNKSIRNETKNSRLVPAGALLTAKRGDILEYIITVEVAEDGADGEGVRLSYSFPEEIFSRYRGHASVYVKGSTTLNGEPVADKSGGGFPLSGNGIRLQSSDSGDKGRIKAGASVEVAFQVEVARGEYEVFSEDLPLPDREEDREYLVKAECPAGSSSNTIALKSVRAFKDNGNKNNQAAIRYELTEGELQLGGGVGREGNPISPSVIFTSQKETPFDRSEKKNPIIVAAESSRIFKVATGATLGLSGVTLRGGDPGFNSENGGLIYSAGNVDLRAGTLLTRGRALNGGAIYMEGNRSLFIEDSRLEKNRAAVNGGAIASDSDFSGTLAAAQFHFLKNRADGSGGAIFFDGASAKASLLNGTFYGNKALDGSAVRVQVGVRLTNFNNLTVAGNEGGAALSYGVATGFSSQGSQTKNDYILNSAVVGNLGGDCGPSPLDFALVEYVASGGSCVAASGDFLELPGNDSRNADFSVLVGDEGVCPVLDGAVCEPLVFDNGLAGFLPNVNASTPTLVDAASPVDAFGPNVCANNDQRGLDREPRCDMGAIELQIATGTNNEFIVVQGVRTEVDVLANDLGDLTVDCNAPAVDDPMSCIDFFVRPTRGLVEVEISDEGYPMVFYTSDAQFHGVDQFRYALDRKAVNGVTYAGEDPSANVNIVVEPESGMTEKENIKTLSGSIGFLMLFVLSALALLRKFSFRLLQLAMLLFVGGVAHADIIVNTLKDTIEIDGKCSLREALLASIDRSPFFVPDCTSGATGRDRIIIQVPGTIRLNRTLDVANSAVSIEGLGPGITTLRPADGGDFRVIQATSSLILRNLTIAGGRSEGDGGGIFTSAALTLDGVELRGNRSQANGGAVYLNYNSDQRRNFLILRSYFHNNRAEGDGGALSMVAQNQQHDIVIDSSTFRANHAVSGEGGALDVNLPRGGALKILNSTFTENQAADGGLALDISDVSSTVNVDVMNSTFINNAPVPAGRGAIDIGDSGTNLTLSHSIYVDSGNCSTGSGRVFHNNYNVFGDALPDRCSAAIANNNQGYCSGTHCVAPSVDIKNVMNAGQLTTGQFSGGLYIPPHFPILRVEFGNPAYDLIVDAGNTALDQSASSGTPRACRSEDLRGASRLSGPACDIGAYELEMPTALADIANNQNRSGRQLRIDVLANDLLGDGVPDAGGQVVPNRLLRGTIDLDPTTPGATAVNTIITDDGREVTLRRVHNGTWSFDYTGTELEDGVYEVAAVVYNRSDAAIASAVQDIVIRSPARPDDEDDLQSFSSSTIRITRIDPDNGLDDNDFITTQRRLVIHGVSNAAPGARVEVYLDGDLIGETKVNVASGLCGGEPGSAREDEDCIVRYDPGLLTCDSFEESSIEDIFHYRFSVTNTQSGVTVSSPGQVTARISNLPPVFASQTLESRAGESVVFDLDAFDPDGPELDFRNIELKSPPQFAATQLREVEAGGVSQSRFLVFGIRGKGAIDPDAENRLPGVEGLGVVVDPVARTVTYTPRDVQKQFNDRFSLGIRDECGAEGVAEFRVRYPERQVTGGAFGWLSLSVLMLLLRRRVAHS